MSNLDRLYNNLPAVHRRRDADRGDPLRTLLRVMGRELNIFEEDLNQLYDNWFIETCDEWAVPYLGDLLGLQGLHPGAPGIFSQRSVVANTLAYRRRKGTSMMLEQLAKDTTGWPARVVEFFKLLAYTPHVNHTRPNNLGTADLKRRDESELINSPFEQFAHTVDVRRMDQGGRYNIAGIGLFLWQLQSYEINRAVPRARVLPDETIQAGCYYLHPLGHDLTLFNIPRTETDIEQFAEEINLPAALRENAIRSELENIRMAQVKNQHFKPLYFEDGNPVFQIFADGTEVKPEEILALDLVDWKRPPDKWVHNEYRPGREDEAEKLVLETYELDIKVALDVRRGRIAFAEGFNPSSVEAGYSYGFSSNLGGGSYNRLDTLRERLPESFDWQVGVGRDVTAAAGGKIYSDLTLAVDAWNALDAGTTGLLLLMDNHSYTDDLLIKIPHDSRLYIVSADWPVVGEVPDIRDGERLPGSLSPEGKRPCLLGNLQVEGLASESENPGSLLINGVLTEKALEILPGNLGRLLISHSNLHGISELQGGTTNENLELTFERSISRNFFSLEAPAKLTLEDSILKSRLTIDPADPGGPSEHALDASAAAVVLEGVTLLGKCRIRFMEATNTLFTDTTMVERRQQGCARYSYIPEGSETPRRFRCQPDLALQNPELYPDRSAEERALLIKTSLSPVFESRAEEHPAYARLSRSCALEIRAGGEDGKEIGAYSHLMQPQREANLRSALDEYLRFGREAGLFFIQSVPDLEEEV